jgi:outer membrane protein TolC
VALLVGRAEAILTALLHEIERVDREGMLALGVRERRAGVEAARTASRAAGSLPDPKLAFGIDNLPATGPDQWRVNRDFMTMRKIGLMQEFTNGAKRRAEAEAALAAVDEAEAQRRVRVQAVRTSTALAWLNRYYVERRLWFRREDPQHDTFLLGFDLEFAQFRWQQDKVDASKAQRLAVPR